MSESKWKAVQQSDHPYGLLELHGSALTCYGFLNSPDGAHRVEVESDMRLVTAAQDLLAACRDVVPMLEAYLSFEDDQQCQGEILQSIDRARSAIAKATAEPEGTDE